MKINTMHVHIKKSETANNKGSSSQLVAYLEKENRLAEQLNNQPEYWFNPEKNDIQACQVRQGIDGNVANIDVRHAQNYNWK